MIILLPIKSNSVDYKLLVFGKDSNSNSFKEAYTTATTMIGEISDSGSSTMPKSKKIYVYIPLTPLDPVLPANVSGKRIDVKEQDGISR